MAAILPLRFCRQATRTMVAEGEKRSRHGASPHEVTIGFGRPDSPKSRRDSRVTHPVRKFPLAANLHLHSKARAP